MAGRAEIATDHPRHHIAERGDMIFRLFHIIGTGNTELREILTELGQGFFVQETGQIEGAVGNKFATSDSVKQLVEFCVGGFDSRRARRGRKGGDGLAERRVVPFEATGELKTVLVRRTRKVMRK